MHIKMRRKIFYFRIRIEKEKLLFQNHKSIKCGYDYLQKSVKSCKYYKLDH